MGALARRLVSTAAVGLMATACRSASDGTPAWAVDTITLDPGATTPFALQAWTLHDDRWANRATPKALVCSIVVELTLQDGATDCDDCDSAYAVTDQRVVDTDCAEETLEAFVLLDRTTALGVGSLADDLVADLPVQGAVGGKVRVADRWLDHGWAYPTGAEAGTVEAGPWDGVRAFTLQPAWAWDLGDTARAPTQRDTDVAAQASAP